jgi:hypothetical protein
MEGREEEGNDEDGWFRKRGRRTTFSGKFWMGNFCTCGGLGFWMGRDLPCESLMTGFERATNSSRPFCVCCQSGLPFLHLS